MVPGLSVATRFGSLVVRGLSNLQVGAGYLEVGGDLTWIMSHTDTLRDAAARLNALLFFTLRGDPSITASEFTFHVSVIKRKLIMMTMLLDEEATAGQELLPGGIWP